jgi:hypothetical protein
MTRTPVNLASARSGAPKRIRRVSRGILAGLPSAFQLSALSLQPFPRL